MEEKKKEKDSEDEVGEFVLGSVGEELKMTKNCIFFKILFSKNFPTAWARPLRRPGRWMGLGGHGCKVNISQNRDMDRGIKLEIGIYGNM